MLQYVQVAEAPNEDPIEIPTEDDGSLLLTTLAAQFPGACGLKYRNEETGNLRGLRLVEGRLHPTDELWGASIHYVVFPKVPAASVATKRPAEEDEHVAKVRRAVNEKRCSDLIVLGLSFTTEKEDLERYFSEFGTLVMVEIKKDPKTNKSKGFGFIRYSDYEGQIKAMGKRHILAGRWVDCKIPNSKDGGGGGNQQAQSTVANKVFVGRCTEDMTQDMIREYFAKFGEVTEVYIPQPFRAFAFVTFTESGIAAALCGEDHVIGGVSCNVSSAVPKGARDRMEQQKYGTGNKQGSYSYSQAGYGGGGSGSSNNTWSPNIPQGGNGGGYGGGGGGGNNNSGWGQGRSVGMSLPPPPPPPAAVTAPQTAGLGQMNPAMMEQMSTIMAAALAATQNMGVFGGGQQTTTTQGGGQTQGQAQTGVQGQTGAQGQNGAARY